MTWCQFTPEYNEYAKELWKRTKTWDFDSSHDISDVDDEGNRTKIAHFKHSDYASLVERLVNAFHNGDLMIKKTAKPIGGEKLVDWVKTQGK